MDEVLTPQKRWDLKNKDVISESKKLWRLNNKEKVKAQKLRYRISGRERESQRRYYEKNKEKLRERYRERYKRYKNGDEKIKLRKKGNRLKKAYGITTETFQKMISEQKGVCSICNVRIETLVSKSIHIDHCHKTGKIRGILCSNCNTGLGLLKDSLDNLESAKQYLIKHSDPIDYDI